MVTDSLRYWVQEMHVDGFRFDLGTILAREDYGFDEGGGFLDSCRQDPVLSSVKLIAEPWDCGPGGYQVGRFPPGWVEWNDRYRDDVRDFWRGEPGCLPNLAKRLTASGDQFNHRGRKPSASVNFITAHDGFTLNDLVSYNEKKQRRQRPKAIATAVPTIAAGIAAPRATPTTPPSSSCASARSVTCWRPCFSRRVCRCFWPATSSAARKAATTTPIARTTRSVGWTGNAPRHRPGNP